MSTGFIDGNTLDGVSSTTLYTLHNRAAFARGNNPVIVDPKAVDVHDAISYDWSKFGKPVAAAALRSRTFDSAIRAYLSSRPNASVVALGEGLQTTYWRLGRPDNDWYSVDLEPVMNLRARVLPDEPRVTSVGASALDLSWADPIDPEPGVFVSAEGLLMYFDEPTAIDLITRCAARFPGGGMIFDSIPQWLSQRTLAGVQLTDHYTMPAMPFSMTSRRGSSLTAEIPGVVSATDVLFPSGPGWWKFNSIPLVANSRPIRDRRTSVTVLRFAA
ncbi:MAG: class I SAM-dependent methyltransferase [Rhodococcus sp. (in: high G+C Gram-positive bacteria)]